MSLTTASLIRAPARQPDEREDPDEMFTVECKAAVDLLAADLE
jgi:hypothetical protein